MSHEIPSTDTIESMRNVVRDSANSVYRTFVSERTLTVLDEMILDESFPGATDPWALSSLALYARLRQPLTSLELGTRIGFSTLIFADILAHNKATGQIWTVDPWEPDVEKARKYVDKAALSPVVHFLVGRSTDSAIVSELKKKGPFDMIYVDSSHIYNETLEELRIFAEGEGLSDARTLIMFHDAGKGARNMDATNAGGVPLALSRWYTDNLKKKFQLFVFEPPFWPCPAGLAVLSRRANDQ